MMNYIPLTAIIDEKTMCMSGGLSPDLNGMSQIQVMRPTDTPDVGLFCDLVWSNPSLGYH